MMAEGKIKALGYCKKCGNVVELNEKLRCPTHSSIKSGTIKFVVPSNVNQAKIEIKEEVTLEQEKTRDLRKKTLLIAGILVVLCAACGIISNILQQ